MKQLNPLKKAFFELLERLAERPYYILLPMLVDFFHLISFSTVLGGVQLQVMEFMKALQVLLQESSSLVGETINQSSMAVMMLQQQEFATFQDALIKLIFVLLVAISFLWMFFQGPSWKLATNMAHKKIKFIHFFKRFVFVSTLWLLLLIIISFWLVKALFKIQLELGVLQYGSETIISTILYSLVIYFMFISYALVPKYNIKDIFQKTFDIGTKKFLPLISTFLILGSGFFIIDLILNLMLTINVVAMIIFGFVLLLPYIAIARLYLILVVGKLEK